MDREARVLAEALEARASAEEEWVRETLSPVLPGLWAVIRSSRFIRSRPGKQVLRGLRSSSCAFWKTAKCGRSPDRTIRGTSRSRHGSRRRGQKMAFRTRTHGQTTGRRLGFTASEIRTSLKSIIARDLFRCYPVVCQSRRPAPCPLPQTGSAHLSRLPKSRISVLRKSPSGSPSLPRLSK